MCRYMYVSVVAGDEICWCGILMDGGGQIQNLVDVISCILVQFGDGHYPKIHSDSDVC